MKNLILHLILKMHLPEIYKLSEYIRVFKVGLIVIIEYSKTIKATKCQLSGRNR